MKKRTAVKAKPTPKENDTAKLARLANQHIANPSRDTAQALLEWCNRCMSGKVRHNVRPRAPVVANAWTLAMTYLEYDSSERIWLKLHATKSDTPPF